jgi:hypothetical protein
MKKVISQKRFSQSMLTKRNQLGDFTEKQPIKTGPNRIYSMWYSIIIIIHFIWWTAIQGTQGYHTLKVGVHKSKCKSKCSTIQIQETPQAFTKDP